MPAILVVAVLCIACAPGAVSAVEPAFVRPSVDEWVAVGNGHLLVQSEGPHAEGDVMALRGSVSRIRFGYDNPPYRCDSLDVAASDGENVYVMDRVDGYEFLEGTNILRAWKTFGDVRLETLTFVLPDSPVLCRIARVVCPDRTRRFRIRMRLAFFRDASDETASFPTREEAAFDPESGVLSWSCQAPGLRYLAVRFGALPAGLALGAEPGAAEREAPTLADQAAFEVPLPAPNAFRWTADGPAYLAGCVEAEGRRLTVYVAGAVQTQEAASLLADVVDGEIPAFVETSAWWAVWHAQEGSRVTTSQKTLDTAYANSLAFARSAQCADTGAVYDIAAERPQVLGRLQASVWARAMLGAGHAAEARRTIEHLLAQGAPKDIVTDRLGSAAVLQAAVDYAQRADDEDFLRRNRPLVESLADALAAGPSGLDRPAPAEPARFAPNALAELALFGACDLALERGWECDTWRRKAASIDAGIREKMLGVARDGRRCFFEDESGAVPLATVESLALPALFGFPDPAGPNLVTSLDRLDMSTVEDGGLGLCALLNFRANRAGAGWEALLRLGERAGGAMVAPAASRVLTGKCDGVSVRRRVVTSSPYDAAVCVQAILAGAAGVQYRPSTRTLYVRPQLCRQMPGPVSARLRLGRTRLNVNAKGSGSVVTRLTLDGVDLGVAGILPEVSLDGRRHELAIVLHDELPEAGESTSADPVQALNLQRLDARLLSLTHDAREWEARMDFTSLLVGTGSLPGYWGESKHPAAVITAPPGSRFLATLGEVVQTKEKPGSVRYHDGASQLLQVEKDGTLVLSLRSAPNPGVWRLLIEPTRRRGSRSGRNQ